MPANGTTFMNKVNEDISENSVIGKANLALNDQILPPNLFVLPVNNAVIYPTLMAPLLVSQPRFVATIEEAINRQRLVGLLLTKSGEVSETTKPEDLHNLGVIVKVLKRLRMPDGSVNLLVHSIKKFRTKRVLSNHPYIVVETEYLDDTADKSTEMDALTRSVIGHVKKLSEVNPFFTEEMRLAMINAPGPGTVADLVAFSLALPKTDAQDFLETLTVKTRFEKLLVHLKREQDVADVQRKINDEVNTKITKMQREFFLKEQLKTIKRELGMEEDGKDRSSRTFRERIESVGMSEEVKKIALEELEKFETISEHSPEYNVSRSYLETLCSLPWSQETKDNLDLVNARTILDDDHFGLEKVKDRIIEFLAVRKLKQDPKGSIICLVGPPGVGKTSIGKSIARALGRKFFRFSLGGMRDEAEIKGHRRTYIGAMPGKVIQGIKRVGSRNAVLMLDEIDKLGQSFQGDPASALLEALDPEQNQAFVDHYVDVPFDLSHVLFITTANTTATIPPPLLDRMEIIELPGYTLEEKEDIALRYVVPKELKEHGLKSSQLKIDRSALRRMMLDYAREPGLRTLQQQIGRICRKAAAEIVNRLQSKKKNCPPIVVKHVDLTKWLGPKRFYNEMAERITCPGVVVGLAWTPTGGDILFIEATEVPGSGNLKLTGKMGDVMSESAAIAWTYIKKKAVNELKLDQEYFKSHDFHLHIPSGAIPKDGPSAGITMAAALYSLLSGRSAKQRTAMTGELSLVGKVLPIGGIKEKILAARRAGVTEIILPRLNQKDMEEVPKYALKGMTLHFVNNVEEVLNLVLSNTGSPIKFRKKSTQIIRSMKKNLSRTEVTERR
ncbi:MAG: endopeptidase La, partial [Bdellovibrionales bacterium RIFOXYD1_FULL_44_7]